MILVGMTANKERLSIRDHILVLEHEMTAFLGVKIHLALHSLAVYAAPPDNGLHPADGFLSCYGDAVLARFDYPTFNENDDDNVSLGME